MRELRNVVHRAYVLTDGAVVDEATVAGVLAGRSSGIFAAVRPPAPFSAPSPDAAPGAEILDQVSSGASEPGDPLSVTVRVGDSLEDVERRLLERTLTAVGGDKKKAAEMLKVSLKTVYNKIKQYQIAS